MKKNGLKKFSTFAMILSMMIIAFLLKTPLSVNASSATSYTMTLNSKGQFVRTQDSYLTERTITDLGLKNPDDLYIDQNDYLYIADTGNGRIIKYDPATNQVVMTIKQGLKSPSGVFVTKNGDIYVADKGTDAVLKFDGNGNLLDTYGKPTSPTYGPGTFVPLKVAVDDSGNMYIYAQGTPYGIIQLSDNGDFEGYFTSNKVTLTFTQFLENIFYTSTQKAALENRLPRTFSNVFVDSQNIVYTTTEATTTDAIKKHSSAGDDIFRNPVISDDDATDIYVDNNGFIYAGMQSGKIFVYSPDGQFIFYFGANNNDNGSHADVAGLYSMLSSIAVSPNGDIWTLDSDTSYLQSFQPTDYATETYQALMLYQEGDYNQAINIWNNVLKLNQMSVLAHDNIAKNYMSQQNYSQAMLHYKLAGDRAGYSQAFWEVRNDWLQQNFGFLFMAIVGLFVIGKALSIINKRRPILEFPKRLWRNFAGIRKVNDVLYMFRVCRHPLDSFYELKKGHKGSVFGGSVIYLLLFIVFIVFTLYKGFIYQFVAVEDIDIDSLIAGFFGLTLLFIICNYLVTSINDGEGSIKQIYIFFTYSLAPVMIAFILVTALSYCLTYNESFFLTMIVNIGYIWTAVNIFLGIQETHNYTIRETIKSILLTIFFMLVIAMIIVIIVIMWDQLFNFLEAIIKEGIRDAKE